MWERAQNHRLANQNKREREQCNELHAAETSLTAWCQSHQDVFAQGYMSEVCRAIDCLWQSLN